MDSAGWRGIRTYEEGDDAPVQTHFRKDEGLSSASSAAPSPAIPVAGPEPRPVVAEVAAGAHHACALLADTTVRCWGLNDQGQVGNGERDDRRDQLRSVPRPVEVVGLRGVAQVACGEEVTCVRMQDGTVQCWGSNEHGQLGDGTAPEGRVSPAPVPGLEGIAQIAVGVAHACALRNDGTVACWGLNDRGQVGDGTTRDRRSPSVVRGLDGVGGLAVGAQHSCVRLASGAVRCWGDNGLGQVRGVRTRAFVPRPTAPFGLGVVTELRAGLQHTCGIVPDGRLSCWGWNEAHQVAPANVNVAPPTFVTGLTNVVGVSLGARESCALQADHTVACWGEDPAGLRPDGTSRHIPSEQDPENAIVFRVPPDVVPGGVVDFGAPYPDRTAPVSQPGLDDVEQIATGWGFFCARRRGGELSCWGANHFGQVGDGTEETRYEATPILW